MADKAKCAYCGKTKAGVRMHSGIMECKDCWNWRKLDGPAAEHWERVAKEFLSNIDMYDFDQYLTKSCGINPSVLIATFDVAKQIMVNSAHMLALHDRNQR